MFGNKGRYGSMESLDTGRNPLSEMKWQYIKRSSGELEDLFFNLGTPERFGFVTLVQEKGCNCAFEHEDFIIYRESGKKQGYQRNDDQFLYIVKIFISKQGEKIKQAHFECKPEANEALFFIEDNTGDLSSVKMFTSFGAKVEKDILLNLDGTGEIKSFLKKIPGLNDDKIKELITKGYVEDDSFSIKSLINGMCFFLKAISAASKGVGWICELVGEFIISSLSVPESAWNSHGPEYFLDKENVIRSMTINTEKLQVLRNSLQKPDPENAQVIDFIPGLISKYTVVFLNAIESFLAAYNRHLTESINEMYEENASGVFAADIQYQISEKIALFCGVWNGLVDFIGGLIAFIGKMAQASYDLAGNFDAILERVDSFCDALKHISQDFKEEFKKVYANIKIYFKEKGRTDINWDKVAYCSGFAASFIGTFFIPFGAFADGLSLLNKLKESLVPVELMESIGKSGKFVLTGSEKAAKTALGFLDEILAVLAKGRKGIAELFENIWKKIADWLLAKEKNFLNKFAIVNNVTELLLVLPRKTLSHINYGEITIRRIDPKLPKGKEAILEKYTYIPKKGKSGLRQYNYEVKVGGMHNLNNLNSDVKLIFELKLKGRLPTGEEVYEAFVSFYIKEWKAWKVKRFASTFFPKSWSEEKIEKVVIEAALNIYEKKGTRYRGITSEGIKIEFRVDLETRIIKTAYIIFK
jgi:hypothetical protein